MHRRIRCIPNAIALAVLLAGARRAGGETLAPELPAVFAPARTTADDGAWLALPPPAARYAQSAVLDSKRDRMIVFGGTTDTGAWALSLAGAGTWTLLQAAGTPPPARTMSVAIYDRPRDRMIVFGGYSNGVLLRDVWELSLSGTPRWSEILAEGRVDPTASATAIYDPVRDRMVVFGGMTTFVFDGTNHYSGGSVALSLSGTPTWTQLSPNGAGNALARYAHAAAYDALRDRMLVFGGVQLGLRLSDVWACDFSGPNGWYELSTTGAAPTARFAPAAVYESAGDRLIIYGGYDGTTCADARALTLGQDPAWTDLSPSGTSAPGRWWHSAVYDSVRNRLVAFGGKDSTLRNDAWALSLAPSPVWTALAASVPPPRQMHSAIMDVDDNSLVVFGGYDGTTAPYCFNDVWKLTLSTPPAWHSIEPAGTPPAPRYSHSAIYDPLRRRMIVFGGRDFAGFALDNGVWELSLTGTPTWTELTPSGTPPPASYGHSAIYDPVRDRMIVAGAGVWALDLSGDTPAWSEITVEGPPSGYGKLIVSQTGIYDPARDRFVIFSAFSELYSSSYITNYVAALSLSGTPAWSGGAVPATAPSPRIQSGAAYDLVGDRMIVFGGASNTAGNQTTHYYNDTWALSLGTDTLWTELALSGVWPNGSAGHSATFDPLRDRMIVFGGRDGTNLHNDAHVLLLSSTVSVPAGKLAAFRLAAPYPNPARGVTSVEFQLPAPARVALEVFDLSGRRLARLADGQLSGGRHARTWDGRDASGHPAGAGVFFVRLTAGGTSATQRIVLLGGQP